MVVWTEDSDEEFEEDPFLFLEEEEEREGDSGEETEEDLNWVFVLTEIVSSPEGRQIYKAQVSKREKKVP